MKRLFTLCLVALFAASSAPAQVGLSGYPSPGQLPGTATSDNASVGNVGEYISSSTGETSGAQGGATVTITIATPAVITWSTTTPFIGNAVVNFTTTGALPTGIVAGTNYYVIGSSISGNTFQIATTADNAIAGTAVATSGTQSGTHTGNPTALLTTGSLANVAAISLSAGDWDVSVDFSFLAQSTTSITSLTIGSSTASATSQFRPGQIVIQNTPAQVPGLSNTILHAGPRRYSLSSTTTIYGMAAGSFTVSTLAAWGGIRARRVR